MDNLNPLGLVDVIVQLILQIAETGASTLVNVVVSLIDALPLNPSGVILKIVQTFSKLVLADLGNLTNLNVVETLGNILGKAISTFGKKTNCWKILTLL